MCFSATASFSSSVVIGALGIYSIKSVTHTHQKYFAAIPFLFAVQQFSEGFVWLTLNYQLSMKYQDFFTQLFLSFAGLFGQFWFLMRCINLNSEGRVSRMPREARHIQNGENLGCFYV